MGLRLGLRRELRRGLLCLFGLRLRRGVLLLFLLLLRGLLPSVKASGISPACSGGLLYFLAASSA